MKCAFLILGLLGFTKCDEDWDYLLFSQRWPITACTEWEDKSRNNTCTFSEPANWWTIHGIWPTHKGSKGPWNCNSSIHFDISLLNPIKFELEEYWTNVERNTQLDSLWKHEWTKHGTCSISLPVLDNELKYFNQGLKWIQEYNMKNILALHQIVPRTAGYSVQDIFDSVKLVLGNNSPIVQCIIDRYTKQSLLSEIRICFNRTLDLIDCAAVKDFSDGILTNCNVNKSTVYPDSLAPFTTSTVAPTHTPVLVTTESPLDILIRARRQLLSLYKSIKVIIWFTL